MGAHLAKCVPCVKTTDRDVLLQMAERIAEYERETAHARAVRVETLATQRALKTVRKLRDATAKRRELL